MTTGSVPTAAAAKSGGKKWIGIGVVVVIIVAGLAYFFLYGAGTTGTTGTTTPTITSVPVIMPNGVADQTKALSFQPATITVVIGVNNTVVWSNKDTAVHTVVSKSAPVAFGNATSLIPAGQTWSFTFTVSGTYTYFCSIHPFMTGTVIVKAHS